VTLFWFEPAQQWPGWRELDRSLDRLLEGVLGLERPFAWAARSWAFVLFPVVLLALSGRRPGALGLGRFATQGWRILAASFVVALPFLVWLGSRPGIQDYYADLFATGAWKLLAANVLVIAAEHVWIEGVVLALALPGGRFPPLEPEKHRRGWLRALGFGLPPGERGISAWLGVPPLA
jgi:hypothetical protein